MIDEDTRNSFYIGGRWVRPAHADAVPVINPATEESVAQIAVGSSADVDSAVAAARGAFPAFAALSVETRAAFLDRIHALILERAESFAQAISLEMGAAISYARGAQVPFAAAHVLASEVLGRYSFLLMQGPMAIARGHHASVITPWNWPLYQITAKVAPALAAGCTIVLKPSELSPLSALLFAQVLHDAGLPPGVFNLVNGTGPEVGKAMAAHPGIDLISITGSTRAGVLVAQEAAPTVKRITQELGGKSPNILLPDADFGRVVALGVTAAFRNVGQSCSAPTRMLVPQDRLTNVERLAAATAESFVVGDPTSEKTVLGPVANRAQFNRVQEMIDAGITPTAPKLVCGGTGRPAAQTRGFYVRPTMFSEVHTGMRIAQEEIFGPVLCIMPYRTVDEAVKIANDTIYGLGGHVQSASLATAREVALRIRTGQVHINHPAWDPYAPFGGYKRSGNGREYGAHGLDEYLEVKAVLGFE
jgi:aldehyde dehydrogenase (NAD+)